MLERRSGFYSKRHGQPDPKAFKNHTLATSLSFPSQFFGPVSDSLRDGPRIGREKRKRKKTPTCGSLPDRHFGAKRFSPTVSLSLYVVSGRDSACACWQVRDHKELERSSAKRPTSCGQALPSRNYHTESVPGLHACG